MMKERKHAAEYIAREVGKMLVSMERIESLTIEEKQRTITSLKPILLQSDDRRLSSSRFLMTGFSRRVGVRIPQCHAGSSTQSTDDELHKKDTELYSEHRMGRRGRNPVVSRTMFDRTRCSVRVPVMERSATESDPVSSDRPSEGIDDM